MSFKEIVLFIVLPGLVGGFLAPYLGRYIIVLFEKMKKLKRIKDSD